MSGATPWSGTAWPPFMSDPNELLSRMRRIDQTTQQTFHWVRIGAVVPIVLAIIIVIIGQVKRGPVEFTEADGRFGSSGGASSPGPLKERVLPQG
jgi:hypothetical protein